MTPGKNPASATPSRNRNTLNILASATNMVAAETRPQVIMIRAIQRRAPNLASMMLLGISNTT